MRREGQLTHEGVELERGDEARHSLRGAPTGLTTRSGTKIRITGFGVTSKGAVRRVLCAIDPPYRSAFLFGSTTVAFDIPTIPVTTTVVQSTPTRTSTPTNIRAGLVAGVMSP